jgi:hypothetical protein
MSTYASDIDNDVSTLTYSEDSAYANVNGAEITFNYPEGITNETVIITVTDPGALSYSLPVPVTITPVNDPPDLLGFTDTLTCHATVGRNYVLDSYDEETPGEISIYHDSDYGTLNGDTITFLYPKGIGAETVTIWVEDGEIYGSQNNVTYTLSVTVIDHPEVVSNIPTGSGISLTTTITATFDVAMNLTNTESSFTLNTPTKADINGTFSWNSGGTIMTFTPETYLAEGLYDVTIGTGATDEDGIHILEAFTWNFTADGNADGDGDGMPDQWEIDGGLNPVADDSVSDTDGDGQPNLWEYQSGLNPAVNDANGDADGDGASNLDEYLAGTDPNDPTDKPFEFPWLILLIVIIIVVILVAVLLMRKGKGEPRHEEPEDYAEYQPSPEQDMPMEQPPQEPELIEPPPPEPELTEP